ncbi:MAG: tRNA pseudouridine(55) synthase TruB [Firmicutes bacterium]|nr:tRNA pseudouridine(55) synthase TruB [Bacillota bacterium]
MEGILNVLKPSGMTSHDVVSCVRRLTGQKRVGHTGTLDPGAAGVLPVCVGRATRAAEYVLEMDKSYRAELTLGVATDTEDASGRIVAEKSVPILDEETVRAVLVQFLGLGAQVPPMYSAVRKKGVRLYELARRGETVEREARSINIYRLELVELGRNTVMFDVTCSRGTYVRTLCTAIAEKLGTYGHMSFLLRTAVGPYLLPEAQTLAYLAELAAVGRLQEVFLPVETALQKIPALRLPAEQAERVKHGGTVSCEGLLENALFQLFSESGELLAVARFSGDKLQPQKVFWTAD